MGSRISGSLRRSQKETMLPSTDKQVLATMCIEDSGSNDMSFRLAECATLKLLILVDAFAVGLREIVCGEQVKTVSYT